MYRIGTGWPLFAMTNPCGMTRPSRKHLISVTKTTLMICWYFFGGDEIRNLTHLYKGIADYVISP